MSQFITLHAKEYNAKSEAIPGKEILVNADHIQRVDVEFSTTQVHIAGSSFPVYESLEDIRAAIGGAAYVRS